MLPGRRITVGAPKSPHIITSTFLNTANLLPKDLRFEHGAPNLLFAPNPIWLRYAAVGSQKNQTHRTFVWLRKDVKAPLENQVATRLPRLKNLTHTSRKREVKRTQMVATARFTFACFFFIRLLGIARNETVLRKDVRFKPKPSPEGFQKGALHLRRGAWHSENLIHSPLIYNVSYLNLKDLIPP